MTIYPNITIQYDDFDEVYEVVQAIGRGVYREIAKFKDKEDAIPFAAAKATARNLGTVVDKCPKPRRKRRTREQVVKDMMAGVVMPPVNGEKVSP